MSFAFAGLRSRFPCPLCAKVSDNVFQHLVKGHFKEDILKKYNEVLLKSTGQLLTEKGGKVEKTCCICSKILKSTQTLLMHVGLTHELVYTFLPEKVCEQLKSVRIRAASNRKLGLEFSCVVCGESVRDLPELRCHLALVHFPREVEMAQVKRSSKECFGCKKSFNRPSWCFSHAVNCCHKLAFEHVPDYVKDFLAKFVVIKL